MNSEFLKINLKDLLNGLIMAVLSAVLTSLINILQSGLNFTSNDLKGIALVAIITALTYLSKKLATDNNGKFMGKL